jgi:predicted HTH transcriptional regulator
MWVERRLVSITMADLEGLVRDRVRESRSLDYKDEQPASAQASNDKKSEFAADVSALANGVGGMLVYGVAEERENGQFTGIPQAINGLRAFVLDAEETRLRTYLETALDPRLPTGAVEFHAIPGGQHGPVLLVRVNRSLWGPHMVRAEGRFRNGYYIRDGSRNRNLDARGVREAILAAGDWTRRFRAFRQERVTTILADQGAVRLQPGGRV